MKTEIADGVSVPALFLALGVIAALCLCAPYVRGVVPYTAPEGDLTNSGNVGTNDIQCLVLVLDAVEAPVACTGDADCDLAKDSPHYCREGLDAGLVCLPACLSPLVTLQQSPEACEDPEADDELCLGKVFRAGADMNCDGQITNLDFLFLVQVIVKKTGGAGTADFDGDGRLNFCDDDSDGDEVVDELDCVALDPLTGSCSAPGQGCLPTEAGPACGCLPGWYDGGGMCENCHSSCAECWGPLNAECTVCSPGHFLYVTTCGETCPAGFYKEAISNSCQPCHEACTACLSAPTECIACKTGFFLHAPTLTCQTSCLPGYYGEPATNLCQVCNAACTTCTGPMNTECTGCAESFFLSGSTCTTGCPAGTYADAAENACVDCPEGWVSEEGAEECTECPEGTEDNGSNECVLVE